MKRTILLFSMTALLLLSGINFVSAQEQPVPKRDTVNMDTEAKPTFYYAVEDDKAMDNARGGGSLVTYILVGAFGLILVGAAVYYLTKKKK